MSRYQAIAARIRRLQPRKRDSWDDVSTAIIFLLALICWTEAGLYGYLVKTVAPDYLELSNQAGAWTNASFLISGGLLALVGVQLFIWALAAKNLTTILEKRIWPS